MQKNMPTILQPSTSDADDNDNPFTNTVTRIAIAGRLFGEIPRHKFPESDGFHSTLIPLLSAPIKRTHSTGMRSKQLSDFMCSHFKRVRCTKCAKLHPVSRKCKFCNKEEQTHDGCLENPDGPPQFENLPTNAYGTLSFPSKRLAAEYLRLAFDCTTCYQVPESLITLFRDVWKLPEPDLVVSVIGGFQSFKMSAERQRQIFNEGLINAINSTNGWLLTSGNNEGIAKVIGDAVRDGQATRLRQGTDDKIVCIGIVPWGNVSNNEALTFKSPPETKQALEKYYHYYQPHGAQKEKVSVGGHVRMARVIDQQPTVTPIVLNPDHNHFLLADNGFYGEKSLAAAIKLRAALEKEISIAYERASVVAMLVEGGLTSLDQLEETVKQGTQVLVVEGTGRLADVITRGCQYARLSEKEFADKMEVSIRDAFFAYPTLHSDEYKWLQEAIKRIQNICLQEDQVTVFKFSSRTDMDVTLLRCIMKKIDTNENDTTNLELALNWNRPDVAEEIAAKPGFDPEQRELFKTALWSDRLPFVKLLVNAGFNVANYLTKEELGVLYAMTARACPWFTPLMKIKNEERGVSLEDISRVLKKFTNCPTRYLTNHIEDPFHELFIYAILFNRTEMALYFWSQSDRPLMTALIGAWLCECLTPYFQGKFEETLVQSYVEMKKKFVKLSVGILDRAYDTRPEWATPLINATGSPQWPHVTMIEIAARAEAEEFIAHVCCQRQMNRCWSEGYECNRKKFVLSMFCLWPLFFDVFVRFDHENPGSVQHTKDPTLLDDQDDFDIPDSGKIQLPGLVRSTSTESKQFLPLTKGDEPVTIDQDERPIQAFIGEWKKPIIFYGSPCVKFYIYTCFYLVFLTLYSSVMLFEFDKSRLTVLEVLLYFWQFTLNMEMINMMISANSDNVWSRVGLWYNSGSFGTWHKLDAVNGIFSMIAFYLRIMSLNTSIDYFFPIARLLMILNLIVYFLRIFKSFFVNAYLGPKVIMVWRMAGDLMMFLLFFLVFMLAYSVSSRSFQAPGRPVEMGVIWELIKHGLWEIFGEANPDNKEGIIDGCNNLSGKAWFANGENLDCFFRTMMLPILLTLYMFISTILLVNMLIAIFTHIFDKIDENAKMLWKYQMYFLIEEYKTKSVLPPPFIIFYHIYLVVRRIYRHFCPKLKAKPKDAAYENFLVSFEKVCRSEFVAKEEAQENDLTDRLTRIEKLLKDLQQSSAGRSAPRAEESVSIRPSRNESMAFICDDPDHAHMDAEEHHRFHHPPPDEVCAIDTGLPGLLFPGGHNANL